MLTGALTAAQTFVTYCVCCFLYMNQLLLVFRPRLSFTACRGCLAVCDTVSLPLSRNSSCLQPGQKTKSQSHLHSRGKWVMTSTQRTCGLLFFWSLYQCEPEVLNFGFSLDVSHKHPNLKKLTFSVYTIKYTCFSFASDFLKNKSAF